MKDCEHCESGSHKHSGSPSWKPYALMAAAGIILVLGVVQAMQIQNVQLSPTVGGVPVSTLAPAAATATSGGGETYEQMMARMHPGQAQQAAPAGAGSGQRMVGGC